MSHVFVDQVKNSNTVVEHYKKKIINISNKEIDPTT